MSIGRTHNQHETSYGFRPHPRECLYASSSIISLSIWPVYQIPISSELLMCGGGMRSIWLLLLWLGA